MMNSGKLLRSATLIILAGCSYAFAQSEEALEQEFGEALREDSVYDGSIVWGSEGKGKLCPSYDEGTLDFNMVLDDVSVDIDDEGIVSFDIKFQESFAKIRYVYKSGILCVPMHARGEIYLGTIAATFKLLPSKTPSKKEATIRLPFLQITKLQLKKVFVGVADREIGGDSPEWLSHWLEVHFNSLMEKFLKTKASERLTDYLIKKTRESLKRRQKKTRGGQKA